MADCYNFETNSIININTILFICAVCCKRKHIIGAFHMFMLTEICLYLDVNFVHLYGRCSRSLPEVALKRLQVIDVALGAWIIVLGIHIEMNAALFGNFVIFIRMFKVKNLIILHKLPLGLVTVHFPYVRILLLLHV